MNPRARPAGLAAPTSTTRRRALSIFWAGAPQFKSFLQVAPCAHAAQKGQRSRTPRRRKKGTRGTTVPLGARACADGQDRRRARQSAGRARARSHGPSTGRRCVSGATGTAADHDAAGAEWLQARAASGSRVALRGPWRRSPSGLSRRA